jgi:hypothetical protein
MWLGLACACVVMWVLYKLDQSCIRLSLKNIQTRNLRVHGVSNNHSDHEESISALLG